MGERHSDGGVPDRRVARPAGEEPAVETLLAAALRRRADGTEAQAQAVAAFRAARDSGAHTARTRRRDDWRPREQRRLSRSVRATAAVLLASLTLGGVAVAAIGASSGDDRDERDKTQPSNSAQDRSAASDSGRPAEPGASDATAPGASAEPGLPSGRPTQAQDMAAHCRAYEAVSGRGNALNATAWQRLVTAAGGEDKVAAYCAEQLAGDAGSAKSRTRTADSTPSPAPTVETPASAPATLMPGKSKPRP
ncbi:MULTISPECIES: hypothetical protein [Streptomyces]|nr:MULTISPECIES: hypothetical protein [Streptomyces]